ncbi:ATP-binding cassette domain-containing protein [Enterococcus sp. AZ194]|uniref:ATP-binding cassette domain-containing protein n=1 Tax=Enterococcus sp. AZ194 TaxID=2774629 RepID=UPI003F6831BA
MKKTEREEYLEAIQSFLAKSLSYSIENREIIRSFSYDFSQKGLYVIKGESGCGKTTLLKLISGLYPLSQGQIFVNNQKKTASQMCGLVAYVSQKNTIFEGTVKENIFFGNSPLLETEREELIKNISMQEGFSGGETQLINLLRLLYSDRPIWLLDEPTSALDENNRKRVREWLNDKKHRKIIIISTHDKTFDEIADAMIEL